MPKELNFATPSTTNSRRSGKNVPDTPSTPRTPLTPLMPDTNILDVDSLSSEATSSLTPDISSMNIGKKRGRPRKKLEVPTMDDFPLNASQEEKSRYLCKKTTEMWRFNKLTSEASVEYRKAENERVKAYLDKKKKQKGSQDEEQSQSDGERQKQLSRER